MWMWIIWCGLVRYVDGLLNMNKGLVKDSENVYQKEERTKIRG